jgi:hypothetical protein
MVDTCNNQIEERKRFIEKMSIKPRIFFNTDFNGFVEDNIYDPMYYSYCVKHAPDGLLLMSLIRLITYYYYGYVIGDFIQAMLLDRPYKTVDFIFLPGSHVNTNKIFSEMFCKILVPMLDSFFRKHTNDSDAEWDIKTLKEHNCIYNAEKDMEEDVPKKHYIVVSNDIIVLDFTITLVQDADMYAQNIPFDDGLIGYFQEYGSLYSNRERITVEKFKIEHVHKLHHFPDKVAEKTQIHKQKVIAKLFVKEEFVVLDHVISQIEECLGGSELNALTLIFKATQTKA